MGQVLVVRAQKYVLFVLCELIALSRLHYCALKRQRFNHRLKMSKMARPMHDLFSTLNRL